VALGASKRMSAWLCRNVSEKCRPTGNVPRSWRVVVTGNCVTSSLVVVGLGLEALRQLLRGLGLSSGGLGLQILSWSC